jgi:N-carbamoyl-L-amino-acid hydrolase
MMFAGLTDIAMLFVRCGNGGASHSPREIITAEDADIAARVMLDTVLRLAEAS